MNFREGKKNIRICEFAIKWWFCEMSVVRWLVALFLTMLAFQTYVFFQKKNQIRKTKWQRRWHSFVLCDVSVHNFIMRWRWWLSPMIAMRYRTLNFRGKLKWSLAENRTSNLRGRRVGDCLMCDTCLMVVNIKMVFIGIRWGVVHCSSTRRSSSKRMRKRGRINYSF